jgi:hypothetical protein
MKLEKSSEAEAHLRKLLQWRMKVYGKESEYTLVVFRQLVLCLQSKGDFEEAEKLQRFVHEATERRLRFVTLVLLGIILVALVAYLG